MHFTFLIAVIEGLIRLGVTPPTLTDFSLGGIEE